MSANVACGSPRGLEAHTMIGNRRSIQFDSRVRRLGFGVACCLLLVTSPALAHPHVWVTIKEELIYAPDGALVGVRHAWTFDDMFSAYATQGVSARTKGRFTREELQPIAQLNVESLKEDGYYTYTWIDGQKQNVVFGDPTDYWFDYNPDTSELTLHMTLPLKAPLMAKQLVVEVYDPVFFVDFGLAGDSPVTLVTAPRQCSASTTRPGGSPAFVPGFNQLFTTSEANIGMGMRFASKISVQCP
jgi:ABC-type uncharacterized transport system substrate-binding protein